MRITMTTCINLRERFGDRFRIGHDPAAVTWGEKADPWMMTIPCVNGTIYPHGGSRLAAKCYGPTAKKLLTVAGVTVHQQGDREWTLLFDVSSFNEVAEIMKPRKRRHLSPERARAIGSGTAYKQLETAPDEVQAGDVA
jgi:hypothetical protein